MRQGVLEGAGGGGVEGPLARLPVRAAAAVAAAAATLAPNASSLLGLLLSVQAALLRGAATEGAIRQATAQGCLHTGAAWREGRRKVAVPHLLLLLKAAVSSSSSSSSRVVRCHHVIVDGSGRSRRSGLHHHAVAAAVVLVHHAPVGVVGVAPAGMRRPVREQVHSREFCFFSGRLNKKKHTPFLRPAAAMAEPSLVGAFEDLRSAYHQTFDTLRDNLDRHERVLREECGVRRGKRGLCSKTFPLASLASPASPSPSNSLTNTNQQYR